MARAEPRTRCRVSACMSGLHLFRVVSEPGSSGVGHDTSRHDEYLRTTGRTTERHSCRLKTRYRVLHDVPSMGLYHEKDVYENGWLRNRSHGGVLLEASHHVPVDKRIELNFSSPDGKATFRAEAIVRWVNRQGEQDFYIGLDFQNLLQL